MKVVVRDSTILVMGLLWILYILYIVTIESIPLFWDEYFEIIVVACIQISIYIIIKMLINKKYKEAIQLSMINNCGLTILWQYSLLTNLISRVTIIKLFAVSAFFLVAILYTIKKVLNKDYKISILKQLGLVLVLSAANIVGIILAFYIVHYWIL